MLLIKNLDITVLVWEIAVLPMEKKVRKITRNRKGILHKESDEGTDE